MKYHKPIDLSEYEKILGDHGHISVYYPQAIVKKIFKEWLIECVMEEIEEEFKDSLDYANIKSSLRKRLTDRINNCFIGK